MISINMPYRIGLVLLAIGGLSACDTLGISSNQDSLAMSQEGYATLDTPVSSLHPVRGFDDNH